MAWNTDRRERLPSNWQTLRLRVLRRDGWRCCAKMSDGTRCEEPATDVDHIERGDNHALSNLQSLCRWHHGQKTAREGAEAAKIRWVPKKRPPEKHPGML